MPAPAAAHFVLRRLPPPARRALKLAYWWPRVQQLRRSTNKRVVRFVGLQRSGNHAIIAWIQALHRGRVLLLNNAMLGPDPSRCSQREFRGRRPGGPAQAGDDLLVYSYEDRALTAVNDPGFAARREAWVGRVVDRVEVIVLRDPFNLFASRMAWYQKHFRDDAAERAEIVGLWKAYARAFVAVASEGRRDRVVISFNSWFADPVYRREMGQRLGGRDAAAAVGVSRVSRYGGGSSFDGTGFDGRAGAMRVLERWRQFEDDPVFRSLFADEELVSLSEQVFGRLPGTERLVASAGR